MHVHHCIHHVHCFFIIIVEIYFHMKRWWFIISPLLTHWWIRISSVIKKVLLIICELNFNRRHRYKLFLLFIIFYFDTLTLYNLLDIDLLIVNIIDINYIVVNLIIISTLVFVVMIPFFSILSTFYYNIIYLNSSMTSWTLRASRVLTALHFAHFL